MRILYVVSRPLEINTSASIRNRATIEGLIQLGHYVHLITTQPDENHPNYDNSLHIQGLKTTYLQLGGIQNIVKIGRKVNFLKPLKSFFYKCLESINIYDNLKAIVYHVETLNLSDKDYDLVISSSDPKSSHLFVDKMFKKNILSKTPWIQIWGDPFFSDVTRNNKSLDKKIKKEEKRLLKFPSKVVYVSYSTLIQQKKAYPAFYDKMQYVPIPYLKEENYPEVDLSKESLTFLYSGDYSSNIRNIEPLYNAIKFTKHRLIICGHSDLKLKSTDRIKIYPRVSFKKIKEFEKNSDVLVHLSNKSGTQIPGKIYQYSGTNKPIFFILDGDVLTLKNSFLKYNRFVFCNNEYEELILSINKFERVSKSIINLPLTAFKAENIARLLLKDLNEK